MQDSLLPDRIVLGVTSQRSADVLRRVYSGLPPRVSPVLLMDIETAELAKLSANAVLAVKTVAHQWPGESARLQIADVVELARALAHDSRIGGRF